MNEAAKSKVLDVHSPVCVCTYLDWSYNRNWVAHNSARIEAGERETHRRGRVRRRPVSYASKSLNQLAQIESELALACDGGRGVLGFN